jgi:hypothetical protein
MTAGQQQALSLLSTFCHCNIHWVIFSFLFLKSFSAPPGTETLAGVTFPMGTKIAARNLPLHCNFFQSHDM